MCDHPATASSLGSGYTLMLVTGARPAYRHDDANHVLRRRANRATEHSRSYGPVLANIAGQVGSTPHTRPPPSNAMRSDKNRPALQRRMSVRITKKQILIGGKNGQCTIQS